MITDAWSKFTPHEEQRKAWRSPARFVGLDCGRGSGKTEMCKRRLVLSLAIKKPWPDPKYFFVAPTTSQAMWIAWQDLLNLTPEHWIDEDRTIKGLLVTKFGSSIKVTGVDKPQRIEGVQYDGGVMDECSDIKPKTFDLSIRPTLSHRTGWLWRIGVPKRTGCGAAEFRKFCVDARAGRLPDSDAFNWPSEGIVPDADLEHAQATMDLKDYNEQYNGTWETTGGGIFYAWVEDYNKRPCLHNIDKPIIMGTDFNVDPMAWVLCHEYNERLEVFDELFLRNTNTDRALEVLREKWKHHTGGWQIYGDATGSSRHTSASESDYIKIYNCVWLKKAGRTVHYPKANPPRRDRFAAMNALICNAQHGRRLFVDGSCIHLLDDLVARAYKPGTMESDDKGDVGHITDALGYIIHKRWPVVIQRGYETPRIIIKRF